MGRGSRGWKSLCVRAMTLALGLLSALSAAKAQAPAASGGSVTGTTDWDQWKHNCSLETDFRKKFFDCVSSTFSSRPFHFLAQSIVPGSGVGGGGRYTRDVNEESGAQDQLQASSVLTIREFWFAELKFTTERAVDTAWNKSGESLWLNLYARNRSLPTMTFYGLGPNTTLSDSAIFSQRDTSTGIEAVSPFPYASWLSVGGTIEGLWPSVGGVTGSNIVSIQQEYTEQTAPGLTSQPPLVHEQVYFIPHKRFPNRFEINYNVGYDLFQDASTGHYSFRRFEANLDNRYYPQKRKHGGAIEQNYFSVLWRYSTSQAGAGKAIPFYLQETIGGSDINNQSTLPAFKDYRFRGPDLMTVRAEYDRKMCEGCTPCKDGIIRTVCSHLGLFVAYDAGKVALQRSDLDFSNARQSFGAGVTIYLGKDVIFRMAVALGGGEGTHSYFVIPSVL
jgi:hypothetical protein